MISHSEEGAPPKNESRPMTALEINMAEQAQKKVLPHSMVETNALGEIVEMTMLLPSSYDRIRVRRMVSDAVMLDLGYYRVWITANSQGKLKISSNYLAPPNGNT